jgi:hypothetical protein
MTETNRDTLKGDIATNLPDNSTGEISPADIRNELVKLTDSVPFKYTSQTIPPVADDDINGTAGNGSFGIGDSWVDGASGIIYICADNTANAAIWQISATNFAVIGDGDAAINQIAIWQDDSVVVGTSDFTYAAGVLDVEGTVAATDFTGDGSALTGVASSAQGALADTATQPEDLGTSAVEDVGYFATAAQGALADTATQPEDLGTAAVEDVGYFATAAQGGTADTALQPTGDGTQLTGISSAQIGLGNVDNTADTTKPVSTDQQTALDLKEDADATISKTGVAEIRSASIDMNDNVLQGAEIKDYAETVVAMAASDIDLSAGNVHTIAISASVTLTFSNPPVSGKAGAFTLICTMSGAPVITWPASVAWPAATAPTLSTSGKDIFSFLTTDGGSTWYGFAAGLGLA